MEIFLFTLLGFILMTVMMAVGLIFKGKCLKGSCGGIQNLMGNCEVCGKKKSSIDP